MRLLAVVTILVLAACALPSEPDRSDVVPANAAMLRRPSLPTVWPVPDSIGIPPAPPRVVDPHPFDALLP